MATTPQNFASMVNIMATTTKAPPTITALNSAGILILTTANTAPISTHAISTYIISVVMARSIE